MSDFFQDTLKQTLCISVALVSLMVSCVLLTGCDLCYEGTQTQRPQASQVLL